MKHKLILKTKYYLKIGIYLKTHYIVENWDNVVF